MSSSDEENNEEALDNEELEQEANELLNTEEQVRLAWHVNVYHQKNNTNNNVLMMKIKLKRKITTTRRNTKTRRKTRDVLKRKRRRRPSSSSLSTKRPKMTRTRRTKKKTNRKMATNKSSKSKKKSANSQAIWTVTASCSIEWKTTTTSNKWPSSTSIVTRNATRPIDSEVAINFPTQLFNKNYFPA